MSPDSEDSESFQEQKSKFIIQRNHNKNMTKICYKHLRKCFDNMIYSHDFYAIIIYPDLKTRKQFVHDAWIIAKFTECHELKLIISNDKYFYITREDIFQLVHTEDDDMIQHMLHIGVSFEVKDDIDYKLVNFKKTKVDHNMHT